MTNELDVNKITAEVITDLAKTVSNTFFTKAKSYFTELQKKDEIYFGSAYEKYLTYSKSIHESIKTLLYRHEPKPIYSFYESVGLKCGKNVLETTNINNIIKLGNKLIITGTGGIGKSVMLKHFFLNTLQCTDYIPILVELRGLNEFDEKSINIVDYIYNIMKTLKFELDKEYFEFSLQVGGYVILLDGFDEVKNNLSEKVTREIFSLSEKYPDNYYVLSSRPLDEFVGWSQFKELHSMPLTKSQALSLIQKLEYDDKIKDKFYKDLDECLFEKYKTFASNPLLLTIMLLTFENRASIPDKLNDFYEQAFTTLFHTHDATKGAYKRDIHSLLGYEDFKAVFSYFCFKSFFNSDYKFSENKVLEYIGLAKKRNIIKEDFDTMDYLKDLTNSVCMLVHDGLEYRFAHRTFQEYFAALYTVQLDDEQQKRFLKMWLKENSCRITSNYLDMLYDLQPSRFIKNILTPAIRELEELYNQNKKSNEWLIDFMYEDVEATEYVDSKTHCRVTIKELYFHDMITRTCKIGGFFNDEMKFNKEEDSKKEKPLINILKKQYGLETSVSFKELKEKGYWNETLTALNWVVKRYEFALDYINSIDKNLIYRKKKFTSMLEEL